MVVVYGTVCRDRIHRVEKLPAPGGYEEILEEFESLGGEAANTAIALRRWGGEAVLAGNSIGTEAGARLLEESGLSDQYLPKSLHPEPVCDIYVTPDGQRTMFGRGFRDLDQWGGPDLAPLQSGAWLTIDANHGEGSHIVARRAIELGMRVYIEDLTPPLPRFDVWQSSTDWVAKHGDIQFNTTWLEGWVSEQGGFGILSDGANGFVAGGQLGGNCHPVQHYPPFPCTKVVDSTGAGDVFRAGMLLGLDQGWPLPDCLRFASAAGSLNCRGLGAVSALPSKEEVLGMIAQHPQIARSYG